MLFPLHVEGSSIKDASGNTVILKGTGKIHWDDDPTGWWLPISGTGSWSQGYLNWNEANVRANLRAMKSWGMNVVRFHINADWLLQDNFTFKTWTGSYRNNLKRTYEIAAEEGMYVIMDLFPQSNGRSLNYIPWVPYTAASTALFPSKQAFVDYWANVANELKGYPNVIFELCNEPHAGEAASLGFTVKQARDDFFDAQQRAITAIRGTGATNLIIVTWGLAAVPHMGWESASAVNLGYVEQYPLVDPLNGLIYTAHLYRTYLNPIWGPSYNYTDCYAKMVQMQVQYVVQNLSKPVIIGEIGVNMYEDNTIIKASGLTSLGEELQWTRNVFNISNQWGVGYVVWEWSLPSQWQLPGNLPTSEGTAIATTWGQVLIDAIKMGEGGDTTPFLGQLEEGVYAISVPSVVTVTPDTYNFKQWNDGDTNPTKTITLTSDISLTAIYEKAIGLATLRGIVKDNKGNPIADADVSCNGVSTKTLADGSYEFKDLENRPYTITISKAGYQSITIQVDASNGGTINLPETMLSPTPIISSWIIPAAVLSLLAVVTVVAVRKKG